MLHYLFGFSGRINRAKMWLFLLATFVWEIVLIPVAIFGLHWTHYLQALQSFTQSEHSPFAPAPIPLPDPISGTAWIGVGVIALIVALYVVAYFAVFLKRLHDRNKGAIWLIPFLVVPWGLNAFVWFSGPMVQGWPHALFVGPMGMARSVAYLIVVVLGLWALVELYFLRGTSGDNRFGPDPLAK
jgi:uncharacterized membrane protein YhaH (DUF805 family)